MTHMTQPMHAGPPLEHFCINTVPDFTPLGGSRPDAAVVACAGVSLYTDGLPGDVLLPPDVLDTTLGMLCAPLIVTHAGDLLGREAHFRCATLSIRLRTTDPGVLKGLRTISVGMEGLSAAFQLDESVTLLPNGVMDEPWPSVTSVDLQRTYIRGMGDEWLTRCANLTSVTLPASLSEVGDDFLSACPQLQHVDIRHTRLPRVGCRFLRFCTTLTFLALPSSLTEIGDDALWSCRLLECVDLRCTSLHHIGSDFLCGCIRLTSVELPSSLIELGDKFLRSCDSLARIDLRGTQIRAIGHDFLNGCDNVTALELPESLTEIPAWFVSGRQRLERIDLRHTALQTIPEGFAMCCPRLTSVYLPDTVTEVGDNFLCGCGHHCVEVVSGSTAVRAAVAKLHNNVNGNSDKQQ